MQLGHADHEFSVGALAVDTSVVLRHALVRAFGGLDFDIRRFGDPDIKLICL